MVWDYWFAYERDRPPIAARPDASYLTEQGGLPARQKLFPLVCLSTSFCPEGFS